jgi:hypothetical protein
MGQPLGSQTHLLYFIMFYGWGVCSYFVGP